MRAGRRSRATWRCWPGRPKRCWAPSARSPLHPPPVKRRVLERVSRLAPEAPLPGFDVPSGAGGRRPRPAGDGRCDACWSSLAGFGLLSRGPRRRWRQLAPGESRRRRRSRCPPADREPAPRLPRLRPAALVTPARRHGERGRAAGLGRGRLLAVRRDQGHGHHPRPVRAGRGLRAAADRLDRLDARASWVGPSGWRAAAGWNARPAPGLRRITDQHHHRRLGAARAEAAQPAHRRLAPARHRQRTTTSTWGWSGAG